MLFSQRKTIIKLNTLSVQQSISIIVFQSSLERKQKNKFHNKLFDNIPKSNNDKHRSTII